MKTENLMAGGVEDLLSIYIADIYTDKNNAVLEQFQSWLLELIPGAVDDFYQQLMRNEAVHFFLSQDQVSNRLKHTLAEFTGSPDYMHLINNADKKLYEAKHTGKNRVCY